VEAHENLASYRSCVERVGAGWEEFRARRREHLLERERFGHAAERATENILEDLFTSVLDWSIGDVNHQVGYADLLLSRLGVKHLVVEAKRPGALTWNRHALERALEQARRYAAEQKVRNIAVSDGQTIYAAEVVHGGLRDRCFASLDAAEPPAEELFWLSRHGIYRPAQERGPAPLPASEPEETAEVRSEGTPEDGLLHPKYGLPADCFAYVGDAGDPKSWHLPFLLEDGAVDLRRLPKAIQSILSNYRGATLTSVPEAAIPDVLVRLACAATTAGKMPDQVAAPAAAYHSSPKPSTS
jgi:hypothetical protein